MRAIFTLAVKDLRLLVRDKLGLFWVIAFPLLMALFFGSIFGGSGGGARSMRIATITDTTSPLAQRFYGQLGKAEVLQLVPMSRDSATMLVRRGEIVAFVEFRSRAASVFQMFSDDSAGIDVGIDPKRKAEAGYLNGLINQAYFTMLQSAMSDTHGWRENLQRGLGSLDTATGLSSLDRGLYRRFFSSLDVFLSNLDSVNRTDSTSDSTRSVGGFGDVNVKFTDVSVNRVGPRSSFEITFPQSLQWALIGTAAAFGLSIVIERTRGTFLRLRLAPISRAHILAGKGLACFLASFTVCVLLMVIGVLIFKVQVVAPLGLLVAIASSAFCFVGLMMLMSVLGKTEASVSGAGWAMFLVFSMIGGGMVPLMMMPRWMAAIANFSPVKWSVLATEGAIWRGFSAAEMLPPVAVLCGIGVAGYLFGVWILRRADG